MHEPICKTRAGHYAAVAFNQADSFEAKPCAKLGGCLAKAQGATKGI